MQSVVLDSSPAVAPAATPLEKAGLSVFGRYRCLDAVRGLAAIFVVLTHWEEWTAPSVLHRDPTFMDQASKLFESAFRFTFWAGGGIHPSIIVFIVLSGFCIHLPLATDPSRRGRTGFWRIYAFRRLMRIGPVYWLACLLGVLALYLATAYPSLAPRAYLSELDAVGFATKMTFLSAFLPSLPTGLGNGPLSTVAVEMWLYAAYPMMLLARGIGSWVSVFILAGLA